MNYLRRSPFLRCLIDKVVLHRVKSDRAHIRIIWKGGADTLVVLPVKVSTRQRLGELFPLKQALSALFNLQKSDQTIADELTQQGYRSPMSDRLLVSTVQTFRREQGIFRQGGCTHQRQVAGYLTIPQLAEKLQLKASWLYNRIEKGRIIINDGKRNNLYLFPDKPETVIQIKKLREGRLKQIYF